MKTKVREKKVSTLVRIDERVKREAMKAAESINLPLSTIINNYLYHFSKNKELAFKYPSPRLIAMIEESVEDADKNETSPSFSNASDAMKWLSAQ